MLDTEFIEKLKLAVDSKTLYVMGCFGAPMNSKNKDRYSNNNSYNRQSTRQVKIKSASADTFGFDCVCLVKGILWGWDADPSQNYGGAKYKSNDVPDTTIPNLLKNYCHDQSDDFSNIIPGEFLVMDGHCGVYIGDGMCIESTPIWDDGVQITEVWNIQKTSERGRNWQTHAKLNVVEYTEVPPVQNMLEVQLLFKQKPTQQQLEEVMMTMQNLGYTSRVFVEGG